jgi:hypothetical protein
MLPGKRNAVYDESRRVNSGNFRHYITRKLNIPYTFRNTDYQDIKTIFVCFFCECTKIISYSGGRTCISSISRED